ncbi:Far-red impaired responsive (FAR1) family protein [Forsythia ovata]|uniref:Far-red impaired responsive (FAR1) family protein n=1 Tax=Forsythia ovata TaxID=205694 RepID=A0ABD1T3F7_9LAMI
MAVGLGCVDGGCGRIEASAVGNSTLCVADRNHEPYEGMLFESEDAARAYYDEYAERIGFATRILSSRKSERDGSIISRGLGCRGIPDNHRSDTIPNEKGEKRREVCTAMIVVKRDKPGTWIVRKFVRDHNHPLVVSLSKRRPTFDEKDKKIQELTAELRVKKRLSAAYRDQLLILMKDVENHNDHLTEKVQIVRKNLKELEAKRQQLLDHIQPHS